jgi:hypothetical protein
MLKSYFERDPAVPEEIYQALGAEPGNVNQLKNKLRNELIRILASYRKYLGEA